MTVGVQVSFDASDPARLGAFWAELLGYVEQPPPEGFGSWQEALAALGCQRTSATAPTPSSTRPGPARGCSSSGSPRPRWPRTACTSTSTSAPDGRPTNAGARPRRGRARRVALGATQARGRPSSDGEFWVVLQDPDGNEFCLQ